MIQEYIQKIEKITDSFNSEFGNLSEDNLNWKPSLEDWSIAQIIHHLIVINSSYFPLFLQLREGKLKLPLISKFNFLVTFFGNSILKSFDDNRTNKRKTFKIWEPSSSNISHEIFQNFVENQSELKNIILGCDDLLNKAAVIYSPANKNIVYKLETAFRIIIAHEMRHLDQAREVLNFLKK